MGESVTALPIHYHLALSFLPALVLLGAALLVPRPKPIARVSHSPALGFEGTALILCIDADKKVTGTKLPTLTSRLERLGFVVDSVTSLPLLMRRLTFETPDLLFVDYCFDSGMINRMDRLGLACPWIQQLTVVFYNIPQPGAFTESLFFPFGKYLGPLISDRDLSSITLPHLHQRQVRKQRRIGTRNDSALEGRLGEQTLPDIFQLLEIGRKSGTLHVSGHTTNGHVYLENGIIVNSVAGDFHGQGAVLALLEEKMGYFRFRPGIRRDLLPHCRISTTASVLEHARRNDETRSMLVAQTMLGKKKPSGRHSRKMRTR